jgi:hypothetical protein
LGGCGGGVGAAAGFGAVCDGLAMSSVYGERGREASDLDDDADESAYEKALQACTAAGVSSRMVAVAQRASVRSV